MVKLKISITDLCNIIMGLKFLNLLGENHKGITRLFVISCINVCFKSEAITKNFGLN